MEFNSPRAWAYTLLGIQEYLDAYLAAAGRTDSRKLPLFCTFSRTGVLTQSRMYRMDVLRMIKRRAKAFSEEWKDAHYERGHRHHHA
jgi:hypothetical protein